MRNGDVPGRREAIYKTWWKNRSKLARWLIIAAVTFTVLLVLILVIYLLLPNEPSVCSSSACVRTSKELLLKYLDVKVNPCEDFYRFSCGNFLQNTKLDNDDSRSARRVMEDEIRNQIKNMLEEPLDGVSDPAAFNLAKKFYRACTNKTAIDIEGLKGMEQIFEQMGGWPILSGNNWREDKFDWKDAMYKLREMGINFEFFLILSVQKDKFDKYTLNLKDPFGGLNDITDEMKNLYLNYMVDLAVIMGAEENRAKIEQQRVWEFLLQLGKISDEAGNSTKDPYSVSELQTEYPEIPDWYEFMQRIFHPVSFSLDEEINVPKRYYIKKLFKLLEKSNKRTVANFICWHVLQHLIDYLPEKFSNLVFEYQLKARVDNTSVIERKPRWRVCLDDVENRLSTVVSAAYVKKYLDEDTRNNVISMIRNIKYQFKENFDELEWLDSKTKDLARGILVSSVEDIPSYNNLTEGNRFYEKIKNEDLPKQANLLTLVRLLGRTDTNIQFEKLGRKVNEHFFENPGSVMGLNIVYSPEENAFRIPVGLFQGIFYQRSRPEYMNHGALGTVIAHEIYHIITEAKCKNTKEKLTSRWSSHALYNYEQKLQCLSNHYGKHIISNIEQHANSSNTRDEDMADLIGMKVAYDTYERWVQANGFEPQLPNLIYSPRQLFWISATIHHCTKYSSSASHSSNHLQQSPEQFRVNGALQNLKEFATDFGCPSGTNMNPLSKCRIW